MLQHRFDDAAVHWLYDRGRNIHTTANHSGFSLFRTESGDWQSLLSALPVPALYGAQGWEWGGSG